MKYLKRFSTNTERSEVYEAQPYTDMVSYTVSVRQINLRESIPNNEIWYTSTNGSVMTPYVSNVFGANIVSNVYENGVGIITFDGPITSVGNYAFQGCTNLTSVTIPSGVTSIGSSAFYGCIGLTSVTIPNTLTSISPSIFRNCTGLTTVTIPSGVKSISTYAFYGCTGLTSVTIPNTVTSIGTYAFQNCTDLTSVTIPSGVKSISASVFRDCTDLTSVTIPSGVTSIGASAFNGCTGLTSIICEPTTPPTLSNVSAFDNTNECLIYVPTASVDTYKAANRWSTIASRIYAIS